MVGIWARLRRCSLPRLRTAMTQGVAPWDLGQHLFRLSLQLQKVEGVEHLVLLSLQSQKGEDVDVEHLALSHRQSQKGEGVVGEQQAEAEEDVHE